MKILHTADWHLGKQLHKYSLEEDQSLFLNWLGNLIEERAIDLLLVSGDVFDTAFPSHAALAQYYNFLQRLIGRKCQVVITGGNHDSPGVLNAPRDVLRNLDVRVVGCATEHYEDELLLFDQYGLAIAAVPYLRDADLRRSVSGQSYDERTEAIKQGIQQHYQQLADLHKGKYGELTLIGMGHLHVSGATTSDSEREIHAVGGLAAFGSAHFPEEYQYVALGHIHKPQKLTDRIRYSGSAIPLSFSERNDPKFVVELVLENAKIQSIETMPVPAFRELRSFTGTIDEVWESLRIYAPDTRLEPLVELNVIEPTFDPQKSVRFDMLLQEFSTAPFKVIKPRLTYESSAREADELYTIGTHIEDLSPRDIFIRRLENEDIEEGTRQQLLEAYEQLLEEVQGNQ
jgi:exonuclease SbcD